MMTGKFSHSTETCIFQGEAECQALGDKEKIIGQRQPATHHKGPWCLRTQNWATAKW